MPDYEVESERFDVPKSPERNIYQITNFLGCDFTSSPSAVDANHSSDCINMIRYMPGKIRKRMGYSPVVTGSGKVYAFWKWDNNNFLVHVNKSIYHIGRNTITGELDFSVIQTGVDTDYSQILKDSENVAIEVGAEKYSYIRSGEKAIIFGNGKLWFYDIENDGFFS